MDTTHVHRTYEPLSFLSRLTVFPLKIKKGTPPVTRSVTHEPEPPWRWAPTLVIRFGWLPIGVAIGWWMDSDVAGIRDEFQRRMAEETMSAEYKRYCVIHGETDFETWVNAFNLVVERGGDPEDELEILMAMEASDEPTA